MKTFKSKNVYKSAIYKNLWFIVGSIILIVAWYREKITIKKIESNISIAEKNLSEFEIKMLNSHLSHLITHFNQVVARIDTFYYKKDNLRDQRRGFIDSINTIEAYKLQYKTAVNFLAEAQETIAKIYDFDEPSTLAMDTATRDFIGQSFLYADTTNDVISLGRLTEYFSNEAVRVTPSYHNLVLEYVILQKKDLDDVYFLYLWIYVLGILCIYIGRIVKTIVEMHEKDRINLDIIRNEINKIPVKIEQEAKQFKHLIKQPNKSNKNNNKRKP